MTNCATWSSAGGDLDQQPGLLDLFVELDSLIPPIRRATPPSGRRIRAVEPDRFAVPTDIPALSLLKAGRFDGYYFSAVSSFQWAALHERRALADRLAARLLGARATASCSIDSTSGVNDMSGLCAMMLPDKLVAVFTPSRQSLLGVLDVAAARPITGRIPETSRPLAIFPVPSKIEAAEPALRHDWRFGGGTGDTEGYQARFESLFQELAPESWPFPRRVLRPTCKFPTCRATAMEAKSPPPSPHSAVRRWSAPIRT